MEHPQMSDVPRRVRSVVLEATAPAHVDWSSAEMWRVIVTAHGVPCAAYWVPGPGRLRDPAAFTERLIAAGRERVAYGDVLERFRRRLGIPEPAFPHRSCSVIVCTHRRSSYLPGLLDALTRLDPAPEEVIIVDNDPGDLDCRQVVEATGARYLREDRRGLDNARTTGLRAAHGDLVAFTDDDCVPAPRWLAGLDEVFADSSVGAITGPAFAYELDSPAQVRFEREGGFTRGTLRRRQLDWTIMSPLRAGAAGAGANMVFRRDVLVALDVPFPPELDAGTPTESGGDLYALYRVLAAGWRVVYDPGTYVFHRHRPTPEALHRAFFGYGVGLSATMTKVLVEHREPEAVRALWWLVSQYRTAQRERLLGRVDARVVRVAWDYLRGGLRGPGALLRARAIDRRTSRRQAGPDASPSGDPMPAAEGVRAMTPASVEGPPELSVIVPSIGRPAIARCLAALATQEAETPFEIVVVDDGPAERDPLVVDGPRVRVIDGGGRGAAAARNAGARAARGDVLLFLDDDLVPAPDLVRRHLAHHDGGADRIVIGQCPPRPPGSGLTDRAAALWWHDRFREMAESAALTFTDVLSGNTSIRRARFLGLGGFEDGLGVLRREDWHWGIRSLEAGVAVAFDPDAIAVHEFALTVRDRLAAALAEGRGDALLAGRWPEFAHALPQVRSGGRRPKGAALALALRRARARRRVIAALDVIERLRLRGLWWRMFQAAQACEYARGRQSAREPATVPAPVVAVDPHSDQPLQRPSICAPRLRVRTGGEEIGVTPEAGRWNASVAESLAVAVRRVEGRRRAGAGQARADGLITVLVGPGHRARDRERLLALGASGVEVRCGEGSVATHWAVLDRLIRESATDVIATVVPGTIVGPGWAEDVAATMDGDRIALAFGGPAPDGDDLWMMSRFDVLQRYPVLDRPFGYVAIRRAHYLTLGGVDPSVMRFGPYAPPLELAERALDRGLVVVKRNVPHVERDRESPIPVLRHEWQRQRARGALLVRELPGPPGVRTLNVARGAMPLVALLLRRGWPSPKAAGPLAAYACGVVEGLVARSSGVMSQRPDRSDHAGAATGSTPGSAPPPAGLQRTLRDGALRGTS
jgi:glycosyltransferase involved in cell wall biosynthesis